MQIYKTRQFDKWASREGVTDQVLATAVAEMENGLIDADLGGPRAEKASCLARARQKWRGPHIAGLSFR